MCKCATGGCVLKPIRSHFCTVCGEPHYSSWGASQCCDPISNDLDPETAQ